LRAETAKSISDANEAGIEMVLSDLDLAETLLDRANVLQDADTIRRNRKNARHAYDTVQNLIVNLTPNSGQKKQLANKMAVLRMRLEATGEKF
jgi:ABC-type sugar transport system ATPase subunit